MFIDWFYSNFLNFIWLLSLILLGLSFISMIALVIYRIICNKINQKKNLRKKELSLLLIRYMDEVGSDLNTFKEKLTKSDLYIIHEIAIELFRTFRGNGNKKAIELLREIGIMELSEKLVTSRKKSIKIHAIISLTFLKNPKSIVLLKKRLNDSDPDIQILAIRALAELEVVSILPMLIEKIKSNLNIPHPILKDIFQKFSYKKTSALIELLDDNSIAENVKVAIIESFGEIRDLKTIEYLKKLRNNQSCKIRSSALSSLLKIGDPQIEESVLSGLNDQEYIVRLQAAIAAGHFKILCTIPILINLLDDNEWMVALRSAEALYRLQEPGIKELLKLSKQNNVKGRMARDILSENGYQYV